MIESLLKLLPTWIVVVCVVVFVLIIIERIYISRKQIILFGKAFGPGESGPPTQTGIGIGDQDLISKLAQQSFFEGRSAQDLAGEWRVAWYQGQGGKKQPYEQNPKEIATLIPGKGAEVFLRSHDPTAYGDYWYYGRIGANNCLTMIYWCRPAEGMLLGVVFLRVDQTFQNKDRKMVGWWQGFGRDGVVTSGTVEFTKLPHTQTLTK